MKEEEAWYAIALTLTVIYLVLPSGWAGSPGHFGVFALAAEVCTQAHAPEEKRLNGEEPFWCKTHVDDAGLLYVGPEGAGADPGPACYGLGGTRPTVTNCISVWAQHGK